MALYRLKNGQIAFKQLTTHYVTAPIVRLAIAEMMERDGEDQKFTRGKIKKEISSRYWIAGDNFEEAGYDTLARNPDTWPQVVELAKKLFPELHEVTQAVAVLTQL